MAAPQRAFSSPASSLGPANQQLWSKKPVMINRHVFVLPNRKSSHLDLFISQLPAGAMNVSDVNERCDTKLSCVVGSATWCTSNANVDGSAVVCISLQDLATRQEVKVHLKGRSADQFPCREVNGGHVYLYGAEARENVDFETQSQDCRLTLTLDSSNPKSCLVIVRKWLYMRLVNKGDGALVDGLPSPLTGRIPQLGGSPSKGKGKDTKKMREFLSVASKARHPRIVDSDDEVSSGLDSGTASTSNPPAQSQGMRNKRRKGGEETSSSGAVKGQGYMYESLSKLDELSLNSKVNLCGVVKFFKPHYHTRGTDYCASFTIVDPSCPIEGTICIFFHKSREKLPNLSRVGDVVLLRRVRINRFQNAVQALGQFYSAFHIFDGRCDSPLTPKMSSQGASLSDSDRQMVKELRVWASAQEDISPGGRLRNLEDVQLGIQFDLVAQVVSTMCTAPDKSMCIGVCDGTTFPFTSFTKMACTQLPMEADEELVERYGDFVVDVNIYDPLTTRVADINPGDFVILHGISARPLYRLSEDGEQLILVELCIRTDVRKGVAYSILHENDPDIASLKQRLHSLTSSSSADRTHVTTELKPFITLSLHPSTPFSSLQDVLTCEEVPKKFRCDVQAAAVHPSSIAEFVQLRCPACLFVAKMAHTEEEEVRGDCLHPGDVCPSCSKTSAESPQLQYMYVFILELEDDTGALQAFLAEQDSAMFFQGLPATNLYLDIGVRVKVWKRLQRLFGCDPFDSTALQQTCMVRPHMDCCIYSFYCGGLPKDEEEKRKKQVSFRIFHTVLLDDDN